MNCDLLADCSRLCKEIRCEVGESVDFGEKSWQGWCCPHGMLQMFEDKNVLIVYFAEVLSIFHNNGVFCKLCVVVQ